MWKRVAGRKQGQVEGVGEGGGGQWNGSGLRQEVY